MTPAITTAIEKITKLLPCEVLSSEHFTALATILGTVRNEGYADGYAEANADLDEMEDY